MTNQKQPNLFDDGQLAKAIYLRHMAAMKELLNLGEIKFGDRASSAYKLYKKVVMDEFYNAMSDVFDALDAAGLLQKCPCGTTIRQGYRPCDKCNGSGRCNTPEFDQMLRDGFPAWFEPPPGAMGDDDVSPQ